MSHHDHDHGQDQDHDHGHHHGHDGHDGHDDDHDDGHDHDAPTGLGGRLRHLVSPHSHDAAVAMDSELETSRRGMRALLLSFLALTATAALQAVVFLVSGSVALLVDTIHNVADALTAVPIAVAFTVGRRVATRRYTYGYGRAEDLAGIVVVVVIAASAALAAVEAVRRIASPHQLDHLWLLAVAGVIGFLGNELVARYRIRVGREIGSAALVADGLHARTDGFTSLAVVLGVAGVMAGFPLADPIIGLIITIAILFVLKDAARDIYRRLMDAVDPALVDLAESTLAETPGVATVESVRLRWIGHRLHAEAAIAVDPTLSVVQAHGIAAEAHHQLLHGVPKLARAAVHVSPHGPDGDEQHRLVAHHREG